MLGQLGQRRSDREKSEQKRVNIVSHTDVEEQPKKGESEKDEKKEKRIDQKMTVRVGSVADIRLLIACNVHWTRENLFFSVIAWSKSDNISRD